MRVQNNNAQPSFGLKVKVDRGISEKVVRKGWRHETTDVIQWAERSFPKDERTVMLKDIYSGQFRLLSGAQIQDQTFESPAAIKTAIRKFVDTKKAIDGTKKHLANLKKRFGVDIKLPEGQSLLGYTSGMSAQDIFERLTQVAEHISAEPFKDKYRLKVTDGSSLAVEVSRGNHSHNVHLSPQFDAETSLREAFGRILADRKAEASALKQKRIQKQTDSFMASINGDK